MHRRFPRMSGWHSRIIWTSPLSAAVALLSPRLSTPQHMPQEADARALAPDYGRPCNPSAGQEQRLRVFENKVLRKIFGAKRDEVTREWIKLHNTEMYALFSSPDINKNNKFRRLRWAGHVARMGESRNAYRVLVERPEGKIPLETSRRLIEKGRKPKRRSLESSNQTPLPKINQCGHGYDSIEVERYTEPMNANYRATNYTFVTPHRDTIDMELEDEDVDVEVGFGRLLYLVQWIHVHRFTGKQLATLTKQKNDHAIN
ncbi:hypothetical protein ANN_04909 [Periplaneta americana]|uniref:Uncharacterized protein n=1 Tax=Periplaneta americana TaxID=6978 RepID=A0ABQ8TAW7_PERAM|nr:hypothetical protein ANN_04909 [Periplaneta americana]